MKLSEKFGELLPQIPPKNLKSADCYPEPSNNMGFYGKL
jgi:hypothetical protein